MMTIAQLWIAAILYPFVYDILKWSLLIHGVAFLTRKHRGSIAELRYLAWFVSDEAKRKHIEATLDHLPADESTISKYRVRINAIIREQMIARRKAELRC